jgi:predicted house-cleaning noncanonical NTP pyrophosphatase (MazG superfamily)
MIEIIVRDDVESPHVVRNSGQLPQIHIKADMDIEQIKEGLVDKVSTAEIQKFEKLWSDDSHPRVFVWEKDYLKIMSKD